MAVFEILASVVTLMWSMHLAIGLVGQLFCLIRPVPWVETFWRANARMHQELWLFVPPGVGLAAIEHCHSADLKWLVLFDTLTLINWWRFRDWPDDENRWKRRGRKAKESVSRVGARLVVVPATGGA